MINWIENPHNGVHGIPRWTRLTHVALLQDIYDMNSWHYPPCAKLLQTAADYQRVVLGPAE